VGDHGPPERAAGASADAAGSGHPSHRLLELGRRCDRSGRIDEAIGAYEAAIEAAQTEATDTHTLAEALRRLAVLLQRRGQSDRAREAGQRSYEIAAVVNNGALQAEALNTLGGLELMRESLDEARRYLDGALELSQSFPELRGRVEQNLGILSNIRGDRTTAMGHYQRSLKAFETAGNEHGCAVAYHNLGMISADEKQWEAADQYFEQGRRTAQAVGDDHLRGLCLMNRVEVLTALRKFDAAQLAAETALSIFEELRSPAAITDVQRMLGIVFMETNRLNLAQSRLELAVELAGENGSPVSHGEALCEAGRLHGRLGHIDHAVECLLRAGGRFNEVPETLRGPGVLSGEYPNVVRVWGELVRKVDAEVADHADRVAAMAGAMAAALELPIEQQMAVRLAAQLHEIARVQEGNAPVPSRADSTARLLVSAGCFSELAPIVQGLDGPAASLPRTHQIVSLVDRYDRLAHGHPPLTRDQALASLASDRAFWHDEVYQALQDVTEPPE
jgi:tetratricopeptide (TPR) repeat protein